ncbi:MAG: hypothetical protein ACOC80_13555 [Petrotogales bacterium]
MASKQKRFEELRNKVESLGGTVWINHNAKYNGRRGTVAIITIDGKEYRGCAYCSEKDFFDKKLGRAIALGRAWKNYEELEK